MGVCGCVRWPLSYLGIVPVDETLCMGICQKHGVAGLDYAIKPWWLVVVHDVGSVVGGEL